MIAKGDWVAYYDEQGEREPRELLVEALDAFDREGRIGDAVDLGAGQGLETGELLRRGWTVVAIDAEPEGIRRLRERAGGGGSRLRTVVSRIEEAGWPAVDLVHASYSLPFCRPAVFPDVWERIRASLRPGARFVGELFGERDTWASTEIDMTFLDAAGARALFDGLEVESFAEEEKDEEGWGEPKHWHVFHVIARQGART
jgi:tellurite methyltransferase